MLKWLKNIGYTIAGMLVVATAVIGSMLLSAIVTAVGIVTLTVAAVAAAATIIKMYFEGE